MQKTKNAGKAKSSTGSSTKSLSKQKRSVQTSRKVIKRSIKTKARSAPTSFHTSPSTCSITTTQSATFSSESAPAQSIPKIPKLKYLKYDQNTDILALLKSRGFVNQTTPTLNSHFNSTVDLTPESLAATLAALNPAQNQEPGQEAQTASTPSLPLYKKTQDGPDDQDISTIRPNTSFVRRSIYAGFDPTAQSLHLGNLLVIIALMHFSRAGHQVVALTGGATGMVGDPSGRSTERVLLSADQVKFNVDQISKSLLRLLQLPSSPIKLNENSPDALSGEHGTPVDVQNIFAKTTFSKVKPVFVNNYDWYSKMSVIDFLRDIGKHFRVSTMLAKDSVKSRMGTAEGASGDGISYTEFSYQVLQGYDFNVLNQKYGVTLQLGGSDQWGNITAGIDNIHRTNAMKKAQEAPVAKAADAKQAKGKKDEKKKDGKKEEKKDEKKEEGEEKKEEKEESSDEAHGLTLPLLTTAQGVKFGKSMGNAIWIDPAMTSSYQIFQYLLSTSDLDCGRFLSVFTFLSQDSIDSIMSEHSKLPDARIPQRILGAEIVRMLHGDVGVKQALAATKLLFKDKFDIDMSPYTNSFDSVEQFEQWETRDTIIGGVQSQNDKNDQNNQNDQNGQLFDGLNFDDYLQALQGVPITNLPAMNSVTSTELPQQSAQESGQDGTSTPPTQNPNHDNPFSIVNLAVSMKLCASKAEAKRLIKNNGLSLFQEKITDENFVVTPDALKANGAPFGRILMLKSGQKKIHLGVVGGLQQSSEENAQITM